MSQPEVIFALDLRIRRAVLLLLRMIIVAGIIVLFYYARPLIRFGLDILSPFIVALIVAYIFNPIVGVLQRRLRLGRLRGVIVTYLIILLITVAFFGVLLPVLYIQLRNVATEVAQRTPGALEKAVTWMNLHYPNEDLVRLRDAIRTNNWEGLTHTASPFVQFIGKQTGTVAGRVTQWLGTALAIVVGFVAFTTFVVVITFYFLLDYSRIHYVAQVLLPDDRENRVFMVWHRIDHALGGLLRGQLIVALIVAALYSVALILLGMKPYAILIGFVAGFGNLIPYFGPIAGGVPAALWVLFGDQYPTLHAKLIGLGLVVLIGIIVQTIDGFLLQPRIVGKSAELHPLMVLLALIIGAQFGFGGLILAVPAAVVTKVLIKEFWWDPLVERERAKGVVPPEREE